MKINYEIKKYTTNSGKQAMGWICEDCHCISFELNGYFYQSNLEKDDLEKSLKIFIKAVNDKTVDKLFRKPTTAKKMYSNLCNCISGVVDIEYLRGVKRAKEILARGESLCK